MHVIAYSHSYRQIRGELAEKELILLGKEKELLAKEQDVLVLQEEVRPRPAMGR